jgi:methylglutaconyl-CoA hydratase
MMAGHARGGLPRDERFAAAALHNAFDAGLVAALTDAPRPELAGDPAVRVVVLEGAARRSRPAPTSTGCAAWPQASEADNRDDALALARLMRTLDELPKPTIARVHGAAFGGGVGLVACCDIAIGVPRRPFGLTESRLGLLPAVISPYVIAAIGARQARRCSPPPRCSTPPRPCASACCTRWSSRHRARCRRASAIDLLLKAGPVPRRRQGAGARIAAGGDRRRMDRRQRRPDRRLRVSPEGQEGLAAFLDKRKPNWRRRVSDVRRRCSAC